MLQRIQSIALLIFGLGGGIWGQFALQAEEIKRKVPSFVSKYDLATSDDLLFSYMLSPIFESARAEDWPILKDLRAQVGAWVDDALAANKIAETITSGMPIEGQPPFLQLDEIVADCTNILRLGTKPTVYIRNSEEQRVYSFDTSKESIVVITSGLLKLYNKKPDELRFMVGRELGHLKVNHAKMKRAGFAILRLIQAIDTSAVPDKFQTALPTLALGRFLTWLRESEITADRAGLLCCQDVEVAYSALIRQLHGLPEGNTYLDPSSPNFDEDAIIRNFQQWQYQPLVRFIVSAKRCSADAPFIPDRLAAIKAWVRSGRFQELLNRAPSDGMAELLTIETVVLKNVVPEGSKAYCYLIVKESDGKQLFRTKVGPPGSDVAWQDLNATSGTVNGRPVFFEVWESRTGTDRLLGGFYIQPVRSTSQYTVRFFRDWSDRATDVNPSFVKLKLRVEDKLGEPKQARNGANEAVSKTQ